MAEVWIREVMRWFVGVIIMNRLVITLILANVLTFISGCTPLEFQPSQPYRVKAQTRDYPGITPEQVLAASEKIFQLADGGDVTIQRDPTVLVVNRPISSLVFSSLHERWKVEAKDEEGSTYVTVSAAFDKEGSKQYPMGPGTYHLFFARLDYLLGASKNWMTCRQFEARLSKEPTWGSDEKFLCTHAKDKVPEGPLNFKDGL